VPPFWIYLLAILVGMVSCSAQPDDGVIADTATGDVAMVAVGKMRTDGEPSRPLSTAELPGVKRVFGIRVRQVLIPRTTAKVWLCRQPSGDCINIGDKAETEGQGYRIVFRDFGADPTYQNWKDSGSAWLVLHPHDHAWALDVAPSQSAASEKEFFAIVVGARGGEAYAVRLGQ
jgi:hypothetical protein